MQCIQRTSQSTALQDFTWFDRANVLPPLLEVWQTTLEAASQLSPVTTMSLPLIGEKSLMNLIIGDMINDEIVEGYLQLIRKKSGALVTTTRLLESFTRGSAYDRIDRCINTNTIKQVGQMLVPIYVDRLRHWTFARLLHRAPNFSIEYYDSLFDSPPPPSFGLWLEQTFPEVSWKLQIGSSPKQPPGSVECGPFMLMGIRLLSFGSRHLLQPEADQIMPTFRGRILVELLAQSLDPTSATHDKYITAEQAAARKAAKAASEVVQEEPKLLYTGTGQASRPIELDTPCPTAHDEFKVDAVEKRGNKDVGAVKENKIDLGRTIALPLSRQEPHHEISHGRGQPMLTERKAKRKNLDFAVSAARSFGEPEKMLEILRGAVSAYRADEILESGEETPLLHSWRQLGGEENAQTVFWNRLNRQRFSYHFSREQNTIPRNTPRYQSQVRFHMQKVLNCQGDKQTWTAARHQAHRSSFWTELQDVFGSSKGLRYAALCAAPGSTTSLEGMNRAERAAFIAELSMRVKKPDQTLWRNLQAACELCTGLVERKLPNDTKYANTLPIERKVDLTMMSFASAVSTSMKLRLPEVGTE